MVFITGILSKDVPIIWGDIKGHVFVGLGPNETLEQILSMIVTRVTQVWVAYDDEKIIATAITELPILNGQKVCNVITLGGTRFKEWQHGLTLIEDWARNNQCAAMRFEDCRKGFARMFPDYTAKPGSNGKIILQKEL